MNEATGGSFVTGGTAMVGSAVSNLATGAGGAGHFAVDMDKLPQLRSDLEAVRDMYEDIYRKSQRLRDLSAPGTDRVSTRAAAALSEMSGDGDGQLGGCAKSAWNRMNEAIAEIDRILASYRQAEESSEMRP